MSMNRLYFELANVFDANTEIETLARSELIEASTQPEVTIDGHILPDPFLEVMKLSNAHPVCSLISQLRLPWAPPTTSNDPSYVAHSLPKVHFELFGPDGLVKSSTIRLGLYGMLPNFEYGIRTHLAEEVFIMLAGEADWIQGDSPYSPLRPGERAFHPSMTPHANRTRDCAFFSVYAWRGDISTDSYVYEGIGNSE